MRDDRRPDILMLDPSLHPGYGRQSLFASIFSGFVPADFPLFKIQDGPGSIRSRIAGGTVIDSLDAFNRSVGNPLTGKTREALASGAALIITGQQPGLMTGPMYTIWKLLTVLMLARKLNRIPGTAVLPAFWIASEDHDILEVNRFNCRNGAFVAEPGFPVVRGRLRPVGTVSLEAHRDSLLLFLSQQLKGLPFTRWLMDIVAECDFSGYNRFFASLMVRLIGRDTGIILIDALESLNLTGGTLADAVERYDGLQEALTRGAETLKAAGFEPPLKDCGLFEILDGENPARIKCVAEPHGFRLSGGFSSFADTAGMIRRSPHRFSAGAALRPVLQDAVFPVAVTVGGPSELLYLWQIDPLYGVLNIRRSRLFPRISATILPPALSATLARLGGVEAAMRIVTGALGAAKPAENGSVDPDLGRLIEMGEALASYAGTLQGADPAVLRKAAESIGYQVRKISDHIGRRRQEAGDARARQSARLRDFMMPGGKAQERFMNICEHLAERGPEWFEWMMDTLSLDPAVHQVVVMPKGAEETDGG